VTFKFSGQEQEARWWTIIAGLEVQISLKRYLNGEFASELPADRFCAAMHQYGGGSVTFFRRNLAAPTVRSGAMTEWIAYWGDAATNDSQRKALRSIAIALTSGRPRTQDELRSMLSEVPFPGLEEIGAPLFTGAELGRVFAFGCAQLDTLSEAIDLQAQQFEVVQAWFTEFFSRFSYFYENDSLSKEHIIHQLRKETGLDVSVRIMRQHGNRVHVSLWFPGYEVYPDYYFNMSKDLDAPRVKPQDIDVDYL
jgi:hypothetical protein